MSETVRPTIHESPLRVYPSSLLTGTFLLLLPPKLPLSDQLLQLPCNIGQPQMVSLLSEFAQDVSGWFRDIEETFAYQILEPIIGPS